MKSTTTKKKLFLHDVIVQTSEIHGSLKDFQDRNNILNMAEPKSSNPHECPLHP
jgi:hypothetical protein